MKRLFKTIGGHLTFRHIKHYVGAVYLAQAVAAMRSFINARYLGPGDYGFWGWLVFVISLGYFLHLGTQEMMLKEVPALRAKKRFDESERLVQLSFSFYLVMLFIGAGLMAGMVFVLSGPVSSIYQVGWIIAGAVMIIEVLYYFEQVVARSMGYFSKIGETLFVTNIVSLVLTCWLVIHHGITGIYWVAILTPLFGFIYLHRYTKYRFRFVWDGVRIKKNICNGWPIVAMGLCFLAVGWVDRGIIMKYLGIKAHGYYTFGATISFMLFLFPKGLADVFEPKLHFHHALEKPGHSIRKNFLGPVYVLAWLMPVFLLVGHSLLPLVLKLFLPDYLPGLLVMRVLIWTSYFVGLIAMTKSSLVALNRQLYTVPAIIAAILINAGMSLWMVGNGYGVAGVAVGSTTALCIVSLWLVWLIIGELDQSKWVSFQCFLKIYLPFAILGLPCLTWAWLTEMPSSSPAAWLYSFPIAGIAIYFSAGFYFLMKWFIKSNLKKDAMESVEVIP